MKKTLLFILILPLFSVAQVKKTTVVSKMDGTFFLEDGTPTPFWGFGEYFPGVANQRIYLPAPLLTYNLGDSVHLTLINQSPETHTIHPHGLDASQENDGVPATSFGVMFNDSATYKFKAANVGTFLYHCHVNTNLHAALGMYGMLVVRNYPDTNKIYNGGPSFNKEYHYLYSDMYLHWNNNVTSPGPFHLYEADYFLINGKSGSQLFSDTSQLINLHTGDSALIHLANVGYNAATYIFPVEANAKAHLSDGRILPVPIAADTLIIYPGERYSVLLTPTQTLEDSVIVNSSNLYNNVTTGTNYIGITVSGYQQIEENELMDLQLFPNPAQSILTIISEISDEITFYNSVGKVIMTKHIHSGTNQLNIDHMASGFYFISSNLQGTQRLIIEK